MIKEHWRAVTESFIMITESVILISKILTDCAFILSNKIFEKHCSFADII